METENKYRGVATLVVVLFIAFFVVLETKLLAGGGSSQTVPGANGYNAGEYTGTGQGNNGEIKVKVTFSDTAIESVEVVEHSESAGICEPAMEQIPQEIVDAIEGVGFLASIPLWLVSLLDSLYSLSPEEVARRARILPF